MIYLVTARASARSMTSWLAAENNVRQREEGMALRWLAIIGLVVVLQVPAASAQLRLEGLERLYFERVAGSVGEIPSSLNTALLLPETLQDPGFASGLPAREESSYDLTVHDFELTSRLSNRRLWIREIVDRSHPRIDQLWLALYDGGRRSDVWNFMAIPDRTDNKMLTNYRLDSVSMPTKDSAVFRVQGEMFRPGGAWSVVGKEWIFAVSDRAIALIRVRNVFGLFRGYDIGEEPSFLSVSTEREIGGRYEIRTVDAVPENTLHACRFRDPLLVENWEFSWARLRKIAQCITSKPDVTVNFRDLNTASFIERDK
jgi:hypothetical protein